MSLHSIRKAICVKIEAEIPGLTSCEPHGGRFDASELRRHAAKTPKVLVATMAMRNLEYQAGEYKADIRFVAFVLAGDKSSIKRDEGASAMADALAMLITENDWDLDETETNPAGINIENLYSGQVDKIGLAMWAASWTQRMVIGQAITSEELSSLNDFETFYAKYVQGKGDDQITLAEDTVQLP